MQAGRGAVKANVKGDLLLRQHLAQGVLVGALGDKPALYQFVVYVPAHLTLQTFDGT